MADRTIAVSAVLAVVLPVLLLRAYAAVSDEALRRWAADHGVELDASSRPVVAWYLRTARVLRTWGAVAGVIVPTLVGLAWTGRLSVLGFGTDGSMAPGAVMGVFVGYLVGALYAELSLARPAAGARRAASLVPRRLDDYLPRGVVRAQRAAAVAAVAGAVALGLVPFADPRSEPGPATVLALIAVVAAFAVGLEALERWLVRRPQPFTTAALVAADDAIRAQSVHALAGAGLALLLCACSGVAAGLAASDVAALRATMWLPALAAFVLALVACRDIGEARWRVRRPVSGPTGVTSA